MAPSRGTGKPKKANDKSKGPKSSRVAQHTPSEKEQGPSNPIPDALQQKLLNIFRDALSDKLESNYEQILQEVKGHLYNRDFAKAFGRDDYLAVYAIRWSSSRSLCYAGIFLETLELLPAETRLDPTNVVCLGGGAGAELVALAGAYRLLKDRNGAPDGSNQAKASLLHHVQVHAVDVADWTQVVNVLHRAIITAPTISAYASAVAKAENHPLIGDQTFTTNFHQADLLQLQPDRLDGLLGSANLITLMFTLNELYSTSISATEAFLRGLGNVVGKNTLLLVVDSPGSYSTVTLNGKEKQYPMHWLLDYTLLEQSSGNEDQSIDESRWEKLRTEGSTWFRLPEGLRYPIPLENMRYQLHLYRRR